MKIKENQEKSDFNTKSLTSIPFGERKACKMGYAANNTHFSLKSLCPVHAKSVYAANWMLHTVSGYQ